jgi:REP element-mobilizing transposase RayT
MEQDASYPDLRFLGQWTEIRKSRNHLPHWDAGRTACFVTFRLADSLPAPLIADWRRDRDAWRAVHPEPWDSATAVEYHERFTRPIDRLLDAGHGSCLLRHPAHAAIVAATMQRRDSASYLLHSWVVMPNHVHVLFSPSGGHSLAATVGAWKRFSATRIHKAAGTSGPLWQKDYFDRSIRDWDHFCNVARYIRRNPVKAALPQGNFLLCEAPWISRLLSTSPTREP